MFTPGMIELLGKGILESIYMTVVSTLLSYIIGLPIGVVLSVTGESGITPNKSIYSILGFIVNFLRSVPFLILLVAIIPFTRAIVGTSLGSTATIVPLTCAAAPYIARLVESSLKEVPYGVIEAAKSMGSNSRQIIFKVLLPEAKPSLLVGAAIAITTILGYSAMAGFCGGGGLGSIAINYGYYRYDEQVMLVTVILLVILVQILQEIGMYIARRSDKRAK